MTAVGLMILPKARVAQPVGSLERKKNQTVFLNLTNISIVLRDQSYV